MPPPPAVEISHPVPPPPANFIDAGATIAALATSDEDSQDSSLVIIILFVLAIALAISAFALRQCRRFGRLSRSRFKDEGERGAISWRHGFSRTDNGSAKQSGFIESEMIPPTPIWMSPLNVHEDTVKHSPEPKDQAKQQATCSPSSQAAQTSQGSSPVKSVTRRAPLAGCSPGWQSNQTSSSPGCQAIQTCQGATSSPMTANSSPVPRLDENNTNPALARARAARAITRSINVEGEEVTVDDAPPARPTAAARAMHSSPTQPATQQQDEEPQLVGFESSRVQLIEFDDELHRV